MLGIVIHLQEKVQNNTFEGNCFECFYVSILDLKKKHVFITSNYHSEFYNSLKLLMYLFPTVLETMSIKSAYKVYRL